MKNTIISAAIASAVPVMFWIGGFNFDERGFSAVMCTVISMAVFFSVAIGLSESKRKTQ